MLDQAIHHFETGNLTQAENLIKKILAQHPNHIQGLQLSGRLATSRNNFDAAIKAFKKAINLDKNNPTLHYDLGIAQRKSGNLDESIICNRRAIELAPNFAEAYFNLGNALTESGNLSDAAQSFKQAIQVRPNYYTALANLGVILAQLNRPQELATICNQLLQCATKFSDAHFHLGIIYQKSNQPEKAIQHFQEMLAIDPQSTECHYWIGVIHNLQGNLNTAIKHYNKALKINPKHINSLSNLCDAYEKLQKSDLALKTAQRTLKLAPGNPTASRVYATLLRGTGKAQEGHSLLSKVEIPNDPNIALGIHFELGKLCDQIKQYDLAYHHFSEGNKILASDPGTSANNKNNYLKQIESFKNTFTKTWFNSWTKQSNTNIEESPVFIVGFPRSGTTLLDQILDSHPCIQVIEEKPILAKAREHIQKLSSDYPTSLAELSSDDILQLQNLYFDTANQFYKKKKNNLLIDKLPLNIIHVGLCHRLFPNAKYILALRHPCDTCLSCFMQPFSHNDAMANFYNLEDSAKLYAKTMELWKQYSTLLPLNIHTIKYESLIENFEDEVRSLLTFLDLPWNENVLAYDKHAKNRDSIRTPSYNQVTQPIYKTAKYRWRRYNSQFDAVMPTLEPWIKYFSY